MMGLGCILYPQLCNFLRSRAKQLLNQVDATRWTVYYSASVEIGKIEFSLSSEEAEVVASIRTNCC